MKTIANKYFDGSDMYDKPAMLLDILLVGKFGSRKINTLTKDFTNNMGIITDQQQLDLLADVVASYYKDMWDKRYAALNVEYNPIEPYHVQTDETVNETSEDTNTQTNNTTDTVSATKSETITFNTEVENTKDLTTTDTKNLQDTKTGTVTETKNLEDTKTGTITDQETEITSEDNTVTTDRDLTHNEEHEDTKTTTYATIDTNVRTGSVNQALSGSVAEVNTTIGPNTDTTTRSTSIVNNDKDKIGEWEHTGVEHTVTNDVTTEEHQDESQNINKAAVQPYVQVNSMKDVNQAENNMSGSGDSTATRNLEMDKSVDYSIQDQEETVTESFERNNQSVKTYNDAGASEVYNNLTDTLGKTGTTTEKFENDDSYTDAENISVNEDNSKTRTDNNTQTHNTTEAHTGTDTEEHNTTESHTGTDTEKQTGTDTVAKTGTESVEEESSESTRKTGTITDAGSGEKEVVTSRLEHGNKWWLHTNQDMIMKELELRKNNFYESILKDVASLLTLSVYRKEDV